MPDEIESTEVEIPEVEEVETSEEESTEELPVDDEVVEQPEPAEEIVSEEKPDEGVEWGEFLAQYQDEGLPEGIETPEDLINSRLELGKQYDTAKIAAEKLAQVEAKLLASGFTGSVDDFLALQPQQPNQTQTPAPQYNQYQQGPPTFSGELDAAVKRGDVDSEAAEYYKPIARVNDGILNQLYFVLDRLLTRQNENTSRVGDVGKVKRGIEWNAFEFKDKFDQKEIDAFREKHNYSDYETAARSMIAQDPKRFNSMLKNLEQKTETKVRKKLRNTNVMRSKKGGGNLPGKPNWRTYQNPDGSANEGKLEGDIAKGIIKESDFDPIVDAIISDFDKKRR